MIHFLRDPLWGAIVAILGLVSLVFTILALLRQNEKKFLVFDTSLRSLIRLDREMTGKLEIIFNGQPVRQVYMATVGLLNAGNVPIPKQDFDGKIVFDLTGSGNVLLLEQYVKRDIELEISFDGRSRVEIDPFLLNIRESVSIRILTIDTEPNITVNARIIGGSLISKQVFDRRWPQRFRKAIVEGPLPGLFVTFLSAAGVTTIALIIAKLLIR